MGARCSALPLISHCTRCPAPKCTIIPCAIRTDMVAGSRYRPLEVHRDPQISGGAGRETSVRQHVPLRQQRYPKHRGMQTRLPAIPGAHHSPIAGRTSRFSQRNSLAARSRLQLQFTRIQGCIGNRKVRRPRHRINPSAASGQLPPGWRFKRHLLHNICRAQE